jgi:flavin-dependent dehydrogenase
VFVGTIDCAVGPQVQTTFDALVVGGGPAGSTAAGALAEQGYRVAVLEKAHHPRFHIGESLLPANLPLLERFGVAEQVRAIGMEKWGAEFVSMWDGRRQEFEFANAWDKSMPYAYQVRRSEFDEILIRRARELGALVVEGCQAREIEFQDDGALIHAEHDDGRRETYHARVVVDASGRDTLLGNRLQVKQRNKHHNSAALYAHFSGVALAEGRRSGNIAIYWFEHGWFWVIPLTNGATSVGAVVWPKYLKTRTVSVQEFFLSSIAQCPPLAERLKDAQLISGVEATGNYAYSCHRAHGKGYYLIGDAYAFIDPVFSSGVLLAMISGFAAADAIHACRTEPKRARAALKKFDRIMRHGPKQFSWFIYRVTNPVMRELFLGPRNVLRMEEALLSLLAGDIFGRTPIWRSLRLFKIIYFIMSIATPSRTLQAQRQRALNIA